MGKTIRDFLQQPQKTKIRQPLIFNRLSDFAVPKKGLEPSRLAAHAPETCASTNSATWAFCGCKGSDFF